MGEFVSNFVSLCWVTDQIPDQLGDHSRDRYHILVNGIVLTD